MDEPTNHLDLETVDALIGACQSWKGGILLVSHDQHFLNSVGKEFWAVSAKKVKRFNTFDEAKRFGYSNVA
jgi:ATP-binding cassette subfamily F protein 3